MNTINLFCMHNEVGTCTEIIPSFFPNGLDGTSVANIFKNTNTFKFKEHASMFQTSFCIYLFIHAFGKVLHTTCLHLNAYLR